MWSLTNPDSRAQNSIHIAISLVASGLSLLVLYRFFRYRAGVQVLHYPVISVALADFGFSISSLITFIAHFAQNDLPNGWCRFDAIINVLFAGASLMSLSVIALERYLLIVRSKRLSKNCVVTTLALAWVMCALTSVYPILRHVPVVPQSSETWCLGEVRKFGTSSAYTGYALGVIIGVIFAFLNSDSKSTMRSSGVHNSGIMPRKDTLSSKQVELTKKLALITSMFFIGWFGIVISLCYQLFCHNFLPSTVDCIVAILALTHSLFNSIVVLMMDGNWKVKNRYSSDTV
ncbi:hypothetical protein BKA69DRAFT_1078899 [Paraphysoderma sedebokerense]|nr:hypothetical protein BKA69DRAFT_1078899 [Paraphysoderma sedebokerense]